MHLGFSHSHVRRSWVFGLGFIWVLFSFFDHDIQSSVQFSAMEPLLGRHTEHSHRSLGNGKVTRTIKFTSLFTVEHALPTQCRSTAAWLHTLSCQGFTVLLRRSQWHAVWYARVRWCVVCEGAMVLRVKTSLQGSGQGCPAAPAGPQDCKPSTLNFHILPLV